MKAPEVPLEEILAGKHPQFQRVHLKRKLLKTGLKKNECEECGLSEWNHKPLMMHLEHVNGVNNDHRWENLKMLCPNCHSQTPTYGGRNRKLRRRGGMADTAGSEPAARKGMGVRLSPSAPNGIE